MSRVRSFFFFLYEFVVGDDPSIAVAIVAGLGVTAALASGSVATWWVMPLVVLGALSVSLWRAARH
jgi:hypothetical protein